MATSKFAFNAVVKVWLALTCCSKRWTCNFNFCFLRFKVSFWVHRHSYCIFITSSLLILLEGFFCSSALAGEECMSSLRLRQSSSNTLLVNEHLLLQNISSAIKVSLRLKKCEFSFMHHINEITEGASLPQGILGLKN